MSFYTLTINPAIDKTLYLNGFKVNEVNRAEKEKADLGGKGINVAKALLNAGEKPVCLGFAGESFIKKAENAGILHLFTKTCAETRENIKVVDEKNKSYTDINLGGTAPEKKEVEALLKSLDAFKKGDYLAICGSLLPSLPSDFYKKIIENVHKKGIITALDTSGEALKHGVLANPTIIKPNIDELSYLAGKKLSDICEIAEFAKSLNIENVLITLGEKGSLCVINKKVYKIPVIKVPVLSTVGAGDAFLAGFLWGEAQKKGAEFSISSAASFSAAKVQCPGSDYPNLLKLTENIQNVKTEALNL